MLACGEGVAIIKSVTGWQYPIPEMSVCLYPSWEWGVTTSSQYSHSAHIMILASASSVFCLEIKYIATPSGEQPQKYKVLSSFDFIKRKREEKMTWECKYSNPWVLMLRMTGWLGLPVVILMGEKSPTLVMWEGGEVWWWWWTSHDIFPLKLSDAPVNISITKHHPPTRHLQPTRYAGQSHNTPVRLLACHHGHLLHSSSCRWPPPASSPLSSITNDTVQGGRAGPGKYFTIIIY